MLTVVFVSLHERRVRRSASRRRRSVQAASLDLRKPAPRLTVAAVRDQMVAEVAQLRQDNREMAKVVTAAVLDALRGQVQQLHQGQGQFAGVEEAGRAEQAQYQQQHAQGAQQPPQADQFANFCPSVAFGQLREGGEAQQAGSSAGFRDLRELAEPGLRGQGGKAGRRQGRGLGDAGGRRQPGQEPDMEAELPHREGTAPRGQFALCHFRPSVASASRLGPELPRGLDLA